MSPPVLIKEKIFIGLLGALTVSADDDRRSTMCARDGWITGRSARDGSATGPRVSAGASRSWITNGSVRYLRRRGREKPKRARKKRRKS